MDREEVIITGSTGLVGSRLLELLADKYTFIPMGLEEGIDITDLQKVESFLEKQNAPTVLHLAAYTNTSEAEKQTGDKEGICYKVNVDGARKIADAVKKYGKHLIHFSTEYVFDGEKDGPYIEDDIPNPIGWYATTKYLAEEEVKNSRVKTTVVRIASPFRANYELKLDLVHKIIKGLKDESLSPQFDDTFITPTFVDDIAIGIEKIIQSKPEGIFHLTGDSFLSPYDLAFKIGREFGLDTSRITPGKAVEYEKQSGRKYAKSLKVSNEKIKNLFGIKIHNIDDALAILKSQESPSFS